MIKENESPKNAVKPSVFDFLHKPLSEEEKSQKRKSEMKSDTSLVKSIYRQSTR